MRAAYKHLFIGLLLVAFEEFSGCYFLLYRIGSLFEYFSGVSPDVASVLIGSIQVLGAFASIFMIERIKRRIMIIGSVIGVSSGFILAGSFTHLPHVLIIGLSTSLFSSNIGIFVLSQIIITEIAPVKVTRSNSIKFMKIYFHFLYRLKIKSSPSALAFHGL